MKRVYKKSQTRYIFVLGGVISSVGKGILSSSLGALVEQRGISIDILKCDPYLNMDPGTMSPYQHGEVYVTDDGTETDLDLGHYERFTKIHLSKKNSLTFGCVLERILQKERTGGFYGKTVQFIPHITDEIKNSIYALGTTNADVVIVEVGGTVGDMESQSFCEAIRQMRQELGPERSAVIYMTYVPYIPAAYELKTKPTQNAVRKLQELGIDLDFLLCRSDRHVPHRVREKVAKNCNVDLDCIISLEDCKHLYEIPLKLSKDKLDTLVMKKLQLSSKRKPSMSAWKKALDSLESTQGTVNVALVGKYHLLKDSYKSIYQALLEASIAHKVKLNIVEVDSDSIKSLSKAEKMLENCDAILIPGGFGTRGLEGKILAVEYARQNNVPFFGICFGMQAAVLSLARNVCKIKKANSAEAAPRQKSNIIFDFIDRVKSKTRGGTMRLGLQDVSFVKGSKIQKIYKKTQVKERHRHRYFFQKQFEKKMSQKGIVFAGHSGGFVETVELSDHPWFVGVQYHPEFQSRMNSPHPLFVSFLEFGIKFSKSKKEAFKKTDLRKQTGRKVTKSFSKKSGTKNG